jgi:hypothetical protein
MTNRPRVRQRPTRQPAPSRSWSHFQKQKKKEKVDMNAIMTVELHIESLPTLRTAALLRHLQQGFSEAKFVEHERLSDDKAGFYIITLASDVIPGVSIKAHRP